MSEHFEQLIPLTRKIAGRQTVMEVTGLSAKAVRALRFDGLPAVKLRGTLYTTPEALAAYITPKEQKLEKKESRADKDVESLRRLLNHRTASRKKPRN